MRSLFTKTCLTILALGLVGCAQSAGADAEDQNKEIAVIMEPQRNDAGKIVPVEKTDEQWKAELSEQEYRILRTSGTERAGTGRYLDSKDDGVYACAGCGLALFDSETKFNSGTGWPSFYAPIDKDHVANIEDTTHGMRRVENRCPRCDGHLGHVFPDGPKPTGERYCMNGYALRFVERGALDSQAAQASGDAAESPSTPAE